MIREYRSAIVMCGAAMLLSPVASSAQITTPVFDMSVITMNNAIDVNTQSERRRAGGGSSGGASSVPSLRSVGRSSLASRGAAATRPVNVSYRPSAAVRQRNLASFAARLGAKDAAAGAELKRTFASRDLIGEIGGAMRSNGLNPNNVADTMAVYLVTAWNGVRGSDRTMPTATYRAVSRQMAQGIGTTPGFATASDALKQEIAESMMVQAVLAEQAVAAAKGDPGTMAQVKAALGRGARSTFGFDLAKMQLTASGLR